MKKLFLSSIIMLAVCSFASAQNSDLRAAKASKKATTAPAITNAAAAKPEKAAVNQSDASAIKTKEDGTAQKTDYLQTKPATKSTDVEAAKPKQNEATKPAPVKKG